MPLNQRLRRRSNSSRVLAPIADSMRNPADTNSFSAKRLAFKFFAQAMGPFPVRTIAGNVPKQCLRYKAHNGCSIPPISGIAASYPAILWKRNSHSRLSKRGKSQDKTMTNSFAGCKFASAAAGPMLGAPSGRKAHPGRGRLPRTVIGMPSSSVRMRSEIETPFMRISDLSSPIRELLPPQRSAASISPLDKNAGVVTL